MNAAQLIEYANANNVTLWLQSGKLELLGSLEAANDTFIADLKENKAEVMALLLQHLPPAPNRAATRAETAELARLVCLVYASDSEQDKAKALHYGLADIDSALVCYRCLAAKVWKKKGIV